MAYTTIDDPSAYFQTTLYTGNGGTQSITNTGNSDLQPDWIWIKARNEAEHHNLVDSVRGNTKVVYSSMSNSEDTTSIQVTSFASDGFALGSGTNTNKNNITYAAWQWKAGTSFTNDASSTGIGSIDSAGSFNNDSGFSIVSYTGTGSAGTIKHGLNSVPSVIIIKVLTNTANDWCVYHQATGNNKSTFLNESNAVSSNAFMNNTTPTSSVFSVDGSNYSSGSSRNYIAYCFAEKQGYSKFGSYTGNGGGAANGNFIYTGFSPAFVMIKNTTHTYNWVIQDNKRNTFNPLDRYIYPNTSGAEAQNSIYDLDLLSNGFKVRSQRSETNDTNNGYIFMCFAENPFVTSTGVPATAR